MLVAVSDTHSRDSLELTPHLRSVIGDAETVLHTGDFTTASVLDRFESVADSLVAVSGNRDRPGVQERVPETATVRWGGMEFLLAHGHQRDGTELSLLARQEGADVVLTGHTHRPVIDTLGDLPHINPGSYADPRGNRPAYAQFEQTGDEIRVRLLTPTGEQIDSKNL